jgi:hypothetical protein
MKRRNAQSLQADIKTAKGKRAKAEAYFALGFFHDSRRRAATAIPNYRKAICYGLPKERKAHVFAYLARALWKTGRPQTALGNARIALRLARDPTLKACVTRLTIRIERTPHRFSSASKDGGIRGPPCRPPPSPRVRGAIRRRGHHRNPGRPGLPRMSDHVGVASPTWKRHFESRAVARGAACGVATPQSSVWPCVYAMEAVWHAKSRSWRPIVWPKQAGRTSSF